MTVQSPKDVPTKKIKTQRITHLLIIMIIIHWASYQPWVWWLTCLQKQVHLCKPNFFNRKITELCKHCEISDYVLGRDDEKGFQEELVLTSAEVLNQKG